jgi:WD40 repeat protein
MPCLRRIGLAVLITTGAALWTPSAVGQQPSERPSVARHKAQIRGGWRPADPRELRFIELEGIPAAVADTAAGPRVVWARKAGDRVGLTFTDLSSGEALGGFRGPSGVIAAAGFSPDGQLAVVAFTEGALVAVDLADTDPETPRFVKLRPGRSPARTLAFGADGTLVTAGGEFVQYRDVPSNKAKDHGVGEEVRDLAVGTGGRVALGGPELLAILANGGRQRIGRAKIDGDAIRSVALSPDGEHVAAGHVSGRISLWRFEARKTPTLVRDLSTEPASLVLDLVFTLDGRGLLASHGDHWLPDEQRFEHETDASIRMFDTETGEEVYRFIGHLGPVVTIALSRDGQRMFSGAADFTVREWSLEGIFDQTDDG